VLDYMSHAVPFYNEGSIALVLYLGFCGGAQIAYDNVLQPFFKQHEEAIDAKLAEAQETVTKKVVERVGSKSGLFGKKKN